MAKYDSLTEQQKQPAQDKSLWALQSGQCRWPVGHTQLPDIHFYGEAKTGAGSYCAEHAARASTPGNPRRLSYRFRGD
ncbi:MAG TPA: GcrA family cell cycle regulator [Hyphomicrobium sp.]|nr:GcrA family cell cycle regulator [Hyphomicrobium sp.]